MTAKEIINKTVLPNGLRIVSEQLPGRESAAIGVWVEVGSRHEAPEVAGVSHFLEHMVFKGTPKRSAQQIALELERLGGVLNAFTTREHTCYHARVLQDDVPIAVDLLADLTTNARIPSGDVLKERQVISEEIKDTYDTPHEHVHDVFAEQMWPGRAIGRPIAGTLDTVSLTTRQWIVDHRRAYYCPERIVVAASGSISHKQLVTLVKKHFRFETNRVKRLSPDSPNGVSPQRAVVSRDINQTHMVLGFPTWPFADKRRYPALVISSVLGGGMSSRLFQSVREKRGLVYSIYAFQDSFHDAGFFAVYFACAPDKMVIACDLVLHELGRIRKSAVPAKELHDAKSQLKGNLALGLESTASRMHRLARHELYLGGYVAPKETMRSIDRVAASDVTAIGEDIFSADRVGVSVLGPVDNSVIGNIDWDRLGSRKARKR